MKSRNKSEDDGALEIIYALTGNRSLSLLTKGCQLYTIRTLKTVSRALH